MKKFIIVVILVAIAYFLFKSSNKEVDTPVNTPENPGEITNENPANPGTSPLPSSGSIKSSQSAVSALAAELKVSSTSVVVVSAVPKDWSDSCLGLGGPAESCLTVITPGYEVVLNVNNKEYTYRTDADGSVVRREK